MGDREESIAMVQEVDGRTRGATEKEEVGQFTESFRGLGEYKASLP